MEEMKRKQKYKIQAGTIYDTDTDQWLTTEDVKRLLNNLWNIIQFLETDKI